MKTFIYNIYIIYIIYKEKMRKFGVVLRTPLIVNYQLSIINYGLLRKRQ